MTIKQTSLIVIAAAILLRIATFMASVNFGADSIIRSFISLNWSADPFLIWHPNPETSVWLPLQFYINGILLMIADNVELVPRLVSLIASLITIPLFFKLAIRLLEREMAFFSTACFSLYALHVKYGNIAGSESLFVLFMVAVMYGYHRFLGRRGLFEIVFLGLSLLFAVMIRFEAWMLVPFVFFGLLIHAFRSEPARRNGIIFGAVAAALMPSLFMIFWMYGSWKEFGDILYSVNAAASEHVDLTRQAVGSMGSSKTAIYRAAFWPGVLFVSLSPFVILSGLWGTIRTFLGKKGFIWVLFLLVQVGIYLYKSLITGELAPLARYTILPGTILCLFTGLGAFDIAERFKLLGKKSFTLGLILVSMLVWVIALSPNYRNFENSALRKLSSVSPVNHYPAEVKPVIAWLVDNVAPGQTVVFNTSNLASNAVIMYSGLTPDQLVAVNESSPDGLQNILIENMPDRVILQFNDRLRRGIEPDSPVIIGEITLDFADRAGNFVIYTPQYAP